MYMNKKTILVVDKDLDYDLEGLMADFPTATELERFVFDQTNIVLNLKGRSQALKYGIALDVLNGREVDAKYITQGNPYLDKTDLIPEEPLKPIPDRDARLPDVSTLAHTFFTSQLPHPDPESRSRQQHIDVQFRKYRNGAISYEILGPLEPRPEGKKLDKYGKERPEIIKWLDPRTGEQLVKLPSGELTEMGIRLKAQFERKNSPLRGMWFRVDRNIVSADPGILEDVWNVGGKWNL